MSNALTAVEAAIAEATLVRKQVARGKSKQVWSGEEQDQLKAVAFAWFQKHKPVIAAHPGALGLEVIDTAYQAILGATGGAAMRRTYLAGLLNAKTALVAARGVIVSAAPAPAAPVSTPDVAPAFSPLASDPLMQAILQRRWEEVQQCLAAKAYLSATVMMGGLLESLLVSRINESPTPAAVFTAKTAPRDKTGATRLLKDWKLIDMIEVGHELKWISKSAKRRW